MLLYFIAYSAQVFDSESLVISTSGRARIMAGLSHFQQNRDEKCFPPEPDEDVCACCQVRIARKICKLCVRDICLECWNEEFLMCQSCTGGPRPDRGEVERACRLLWQCFCESLPPPGNNATVETQTVNGHGELILGDAWLDTLLPFVADVRMPDDAGAFIFENDMRFVSPPIGHFMDHEPGTATFGDDEDVVLVQPQEDGPLNDLEQPARDSSDDEEDYPLIIGGGYWNLPSRPGDIFWGAPGAYEESEQHVLHDDELQPGTYEYDPV